MTDGPQQPLQAVLLGFDGTVVDSGAAAERSWRRWAAEEGVDPRRLVAHRGRPARAVVGALIAPSRQSEALARINRIEREDLGGVRALPGAAATLATLPVGRRAIVASCGRDLMVLRMRAAGLAVPELVVTSDDVRAGTPNPEPYLLAIDRLALSPEHCVAIDDSAVGLASARAAGCRTFAVGGEGARRMGANRWAPDLSWLEWSVAADGIRVSIRRPRPS